MNRPRLAPVTRLIHLLPAFALGLASLSFAQETKILTLKSAVSLAVAHSPAVAMAQAQYAVAKAEIAVNRSPFLPNLYTGSGVAYTYGFPEALNGNPPSIFNLGYSQSIFDPASQGQLRASRQRAENRRLELEKARDAVMVSAASDYLELAEIRHSLQLLRTERSSQQSILDVTKDRVSSGLELPSESTRADLALARVDQRIIQMEDRDEALADDLRQVTGIRPAVPIDVSAEDASFADSSSEPQVNPEDIVNRTLSFSPDIKEALNEKNAEIQIWKGERGAYWPTVSLVGLYSVLSRINNYDQFYRSFQRNNVNFGIQLNIPIFNARTHATVAFAQKQLATAELAESQSRRAAATAAKQRLRDVRETDASRKVARLDLQLAREELDAAQARYDQGHATLRDLEKARVDENEKWLAFLDADLARQKAQLSLWQTTGELAQHFQ